MESNDIISDTGIGDGGLAMERRLYPGEIYRHFKGKQYQIVAVARHSETGERMVVYQALYGDFPVYVRPFDMFVSRVDQEKYPDADQSYRFERVRMSGDCQDAEGRAAETDDRETAKNERKVEPDDPLPAKPGPALLRFLDTKDFEDRMQCLKDLEKTAGQSDLDSIYVVLDMKPQPGTIREQLDAVGSYLAMQQHFEGRRLR